MFCFPIKFEGSLLSQKFPLIDGEQLKSVLEVFEFEIDLCVKVNLFCAHFERQCGLSEDPYGL